MPYDQTQQYLFSLRYRGAKYGIERIQVFVEALGHPERAYPVIHVAGTNGKGSVCALLEAIYRQAGYCTGMFTSPHLVYLGERIQVNRRPITPDEITAWVERLRPLAEHASAEDPDEHPSFFEFMTGMAFSHFKVSQVDVGIIETGLGGRLDATNVVQPAIAVITSIGLDHQEQLGDTLEAIASEKAGIIKPGVPVVLGKLPSAAEGVIRAVAAEHGSPVYSVVERFGEGIEHYPHTCLTGDFQRINAATALLVNDVLQETLPVTQADQRRALDSVDWAGRWQVLPLDAGRELILDCTHNAEGAAMLRQNLQAHLEKTGRKPVILVGTLGLARAQFLMAVCAEFARKLVLLEPKQPRACNFAELRRFIPPGFEGTVEEGRVAQIFPAPGVCALGEPGETILATGSIYLVGEITERVQGQSTLGESVLQDLI